MQGLASGFQNTHQSLSALLPYLGALCLLFAGFLAWRAGLMIATVATIILAIAVGSSSYGISNYIYTAFHSASAGP